MRKIQGFLLGLLLLVTIGAIYPVQITASPHLDQSFHYPEVTTFNNTYAINGVVKQPGITVNLLGTLDISSQTEPENNTATYHHYIQTELGTQVVNEEFDIWENLDNKTLDFSDIIDNPSIIIMDDIWRVYSNNGTNPVASIYHIVRDEIDDGQIKFLNFTLPLNDERNYYSPYIGGNGAEIRAYSLRIVTNDENKITAFFDTRNRVLLGFEIVFHDAAAVGLDWVYSFTTTLKSTDLDLPIVSESKVINTVWYAVGGLVTIIAVFFIVRRLRRPRVLKGGLD